MIDWSALSASILGWVLSDPWRAVTTLVMAASAICFATPTPPPGSWLARTYKVVEILALNFGFAKHNGGPVDREVLGNGYRKLLVPLLAVGLALTLSACAMVAKPETPAQTVYAIEADFHLAQRAALAYVTKPDADPTIERRVKQLESAAYDAVTGARRAVLSGDDPRLGAATATAQHAIGLLIGYLREKEILR